MLILRLLIILSALTIIVSAGMYLFTHNSLYLNIAKKVARFVVFTALIFAALYVLERFVFVGWRILV